MDQNNTTPPTIPPSPPLLRKGWTTGTCATAAAKAAFCALITGEFPDPVTVQLPGGSRPAFALATHEQGESNGAPYASAGIIKDAGDDPDVTHHALIGARVWRGGAGSGVSFRAGEGVGTVTKPGLPLTVGEPAINPVPRAMIRDNLAEMAGELGVAADVVVELFVPEGKTLAQKTMNPRLGILGGISILGTTGIVIPFSCSAWIHSIHRGVDVARAEGLQHIAGATGSTSESAIQRYHNLPESALIDMGDFVGGMLKYIRKHPVERVTIAGGFAKITKLAQGLLDLHSRAGQVDLHFIAQLAKNAYAPADIVEQIKHANTAKHALEIAQAFTPNLAQAISELAWKTAAKTLERTGISLDIAIFNREGELLAQSACLRVN